MTCASCVGKIENYMRKLDGIKLINVVLLTNRARIEYDPSMIGPRDILRHLSVNDSVSVLFEDERDSSHIA